jgi:hypothetical protein
MSQSTSNEDLLSQDAVGNSRLAPNPQDRVAFLKRLREGIEESDRNLIPNFDYARFSTTTDTPRDDDEDLGPTHPSSSQPNPTHLRPVDECPGYYDEPEATELPSYGQSSQVSSEGQDAWLLYYEQEGKLSPNEYVLGRLDNVTEAAERQSHQRYLSHEDFKRFREVKSKILSHLKSICFILKSNGLSEEQREGLRQEKRALLLNLQRLMEVTVKCYLPTDPIALTTAPRTLAAKFDRVIPNEHSQALADFEVRKDKPAGWSKEKAARHVRDFEKSSAYETKAVMEKGPVTNQKITKCYASLEKEFNLWPAILLNTRLSADQKVSVYNQARLYAKRPENQWSDRRQERFMEKIDDALTQTTRFGLKVNRDLYILLIMLFPHPQDLKTSAVAAGRIAHHFNFQYRSLHLDYRSFSKVQSSMEPIFNLLFDTYKEDVERLAMVNKRDIHANENRDILHALNNLILDKKRTTGLNDTDRTEFALTVKTQRNGVKTPPPRNPKEWFSAFYSFMKNRCQVCKAEAKLHIVPQPTKQEGHPENATSKRAEKREKRRRDSNSNSYGDRQSGKEGRKDDRSKIPKVA